MKQEILNELLKVKQFNTDVNKHNIESYLNNIFSVKGGIGISAKVLENKYVIYLLSEDSLTLRGFITAKYITKNKEEFMYIIMKHIVNKYVWDETVDKYGEDQCVEICDETEDFEDELKADILRQMPDFYKDQYDDEFDIYYRFEKFVKTEAYKQWVKDLGN